MTDDYRDAPKYVLDFLMEGEEVVVAVRRHVIRLLPPVAVATGATLLAVLFASSLADAGVPVPSFLWLMWLIIFLSCLYQIWSWRRDWLVVTNFRLVLQSGIFDRNVPMLPLGRITDMKYQRTFFGLILGYGRFVLESAGEDQALREIEHVPHPDDVYHIITEEIFQQLRSGDGTGASARGEREPRRHAPFPSVSWMADQLGLAHKKTLGRVNLRGIRLPARRKPATSEASPASDVSRSRVSRSRSRLDESSVAKRSMSTKLANKMLGRDYEETAGQLETYQRTQEERRRLQQEQQEQQHASGGDLRTRDTGHIIDPE